jgi:hypothetical protein
MIGSFRITSWNSAVALVEGVLRPAFIETCRRAIRSEVDLEARWEKLRADRPQDSASHAFLHFAYSLLGWTENQRKSPLAGRPFTGRQFLHAYSHPGYLWELYRAVYGARILILPGGQWTKSRQPELAIVCDLLPNDRRRVILLGSQRRVAQDDRRPWSFTDFRLAQVDSIERTLSWLLRKKIESEAVAPKDVRAIADATAVMVALPMVELKVHPGSERQVAKLLDAQLRELGISQHSSSIVAASVATDIMQMLPQLGMANRHKLHIHSANEESIEKRLQEMENNTHPSLSAITQALAVQFDHLVDLCYQQEWFFSEDHDPDYLAYRRMDALGRLRSVLESWFHWIGYSKLGAGPLQLVDHELTALKGLSDQQGLAYAIDEELSLREGRLPQSAALRQLIASCDPRVCSTEGFESPSTFSAELLMCPFTPYFRVVLGPYPHRPEWESNPPAPLERVWTEHSEALTEKRVRIPLASRARAELVESVRAEQAAGQRISELPSLTSPHFDANSVERKELDRNLVLIDEDLEKAREGIVRALAE